MKNCIVKIACISLLGVFLPGCKVVSLIDNADDILRFSVRIIDDVPIGATTRAKTVIFTETGERFARETSEQVSKEVSREITPKYAIKFDDFVNQCTKEVGKNISKEIIQKALESKKSSSNASQKDKNKIVEQVTERGVECLESGIKLTKEGKELKIEKELLTKVIYKFGEKIFESEKEDLKRYIPPSTSSLEDKMNRGMRQAEKMMIDK